MSRPADTTLQKISRDYPEWKPWLTVIEEVLKEASDCKWDAFLPEDAQAKGKSPVLAGARITFDHNWVGRWVKRLMRTARESGTSKMATLEQAERAEFDIPDLFQASLVQDSQKLQTIAGALAVDVGAFQAVADLVALPFLQACNRKWGPSASQKWLEGYCPICGAWPAFAEVRGIERSRYLRCARCGSEWQRHWLHCPYCDMRDYRELTALVPENAGSARTVDACKRCLGYIKSFTTLQGAPGVEVLLNDLGSADLDIAAVEQGYKRPEKSGYFLGVTVTEKAGPRFFRWSDKIAQ